MKSETKSNWAYTDPEPEPLPEAEKEDIKIELDPQVICDNVAPTPRKGFGLLESEDLRDRDFPLRAGRIRNRFRKSKYHMLGDILDQEESDSCVGHAWSLFVSSAPKMLIQPDPYEIYRLAQELDEFEGAEPDYYGTSLRAGAKACRELGLIDKFRWAQDSDTIWDFIMTSGPVVVGTKWYEGMGHPDEDGFVSIEGEDHGGHAYLICGASVEKKSFLCANSWGSGWGKSGKFWLAMKQFDALLTQGGVACSAIES